MCLIAVPVVPQQLVKGMLAEMAQPIGLAVEGVALAALVERIQAPSVALADPVFLLQSPGRLKIMAAAAAVAQGTAHRPKAQVALVVAVQALTNLDRQLRRQGLLTQAAVAAAQAIA